MRDWTHLLLQYGVGVEEGQHEAAADEDAGAVVKERLDENDEDEGDVPLTSRDYGLQLRVGVEDSAPARLRL